MLAYLANDAARIADRNAIGRYILCDYASGSYHGIVTDRNAGKYYGAGTYPNVIAYSDRDRKLRRFFPQLRVDGMPGRRYDHIWGYHNIISDNNITVIHQSKIKVGVAVVAPIRVFSESGMKRRLYKQIFADFSEIFLQNSPPRLFLSRPCGIIVVKYFHAPFLLASESPVNDRFCFMTGLGGVLQLILMGFGGIRITPEGITATPHLPEALSRMNVRGLHFRGERFDLEIGPDGVRRI